MVCEFFSRSLPCSLERTENWVNLRRLIHALRQYSALFQLITCNNAVRFFNQNAVGVGRSQGEIETGVEPKSSGVFNGALIARRIVVVDVGSRKLRRVLCERGVRRIHDIACVTAVVTIHRQRVPVGFRVYNEAVVLRGHPNRISPGRLDLKAKTETTFCGQLVHHLEPQPVLVVRRIAESSLVVRPAASEIHAAAASIHDDEPSVDVKQRDWVEICQRKVILCVASRII